METAACGASMRGMLNRLLAPLTEPAYLLMRLVAGLMFAIHGAQKLFGAFGGTAVDFGAPGMLQIGIGGVIEFTGGLLIAFGLATRWAAFLCSGTMAVAYTQFHWKPWAAGASHLPHDQKFGGNGGELALLYAVVFLFVACYGGGRFSIDAMLERRRGASTAAVPVP